jgi:hypothetical protein
MTVTNSFHRNRWAQFFIYFAWLCFGKAALDPFGEDEDDINVKHLAQSHVEVLQQKFKKSKNN